MFTLNCKGKLITIETPVVMGIINATPDSFYKSDLRNGLDGIIALAKKMIDDGATIIDVGAQSTKPGSQPISVEEELKRVIPVVQILHELFPEIIISVDTYQSIVAHEAVNAGAAIVNDISAGDLDENMIATVAKLNVPFICMHMKGTPLNMQKMAVYDDIVKDLLAYFAAKIDTCKKAGIKDIILDPGFGFAKTITQNFELLKQLSVFKMFDCPILAGLSRKKTIYQTLNTTADAALNGTTVLNTLALLNGATILRVHDVKEAVEAITLFNAYNSVG